MLRVCIIYPDKFCYYICSEKMCIFVLAKTAANFMSSVLLLQHWYWCVCIQCYILNIICYVVHSVYILCNVFRWLFLVLQAIAKAKVPVMLLLMLPRKGQQHFSSSLGGISQSACCHAVNFCQFSYDSNKNSYPFVLPLEKKVFSANGTHLPRCRDTFRW